MVSRLLTGAKNDARRERLDYYDFVTSTSTASANAPS